MRTWFLKLLAGKDVVVINARFEGGLIVVPPGVGLVLINGHFVGNQICVRKG